MRILVSIAQMPLIVWILLGAYFVYSDYTDWQTNVYNSLVAEKTQKENSLRGLIARNKKAQDFEAQKAAKLKELQQLGEEFKKTASLIPRFKNTPAVLKSFADISDSIGVEISSYKPKETKQEQFLEVTPIDVELMGTYPQVMSFLDAVANLERVVHSKVLEFKNPAKRGNASRLDTTITFEIYSISQASIDSASQGAGG